MKRSIYNIIDVLEMLEERPGKKKFQKIIYLIENVSGVDLGFEYDIHFYGPYSSDLDENLTNLAGEGLINYEYVGMSHLIKATERIPDKKFFESDLTKSEKNIIKQSIKKYSEKSPFDLEALTTTHFVYNCLNASKQEDVLQGVKKIKGDKFSEKKILSIMKELKIK